MKAPRILVGKFVATSIDLCQDTLLRESFQIRTSRQGRALPLILLEHEPTVFANMQNGALIGGYILQEQLFSKGPVRKNNAKLP